MSYVNMRRIFQQFITILVLYDVSAFTVSQGKSIVQLNSQILSTSLTASQKKDDEGTMEDMNPLTRASWYAVETFGNIFGKKEGGKTETNEKDSVQVDLTKSPSSMDEALLRIQMDNDRYYFLSGQVDKLAYTEQCTFSDPFVSFDGRDRFVDNLQNLGSFITNYNAKMLKYDVIQNDDDSGITQVKTKVMVKLELNLPWKPILAWPWGVTYDIDQKTFLIQSHAESWDIEPWEGVKQIFRKPTLSLK